MADKFVMSVRQAAELDHAFERNGWSPEEVKKLSAGNTLGDVRKILLGHAVITVPEHLIDLDADPFIPSGLTVVEHQKGGHFTWDATKVKLYLSKKQEGSGYIEGNKLRDELKGKPVFNANLLDYLLKNPHLIPEEWKQKTSEYTTYVFFWGTIYRRSGGALYVRYLYWSDGRWYWSNRWLGDGWDDYDPAAMPATGDVRTCLVG